MIDTNKPPKVIPHLDRFKAKGYKLMIQFIEDGINFGEPIAFKNSTQVEIFMSDYPRMKIAWQTDI